ncbi:unnamed protein product [Trichogramma brassicae]|uniref:Uncharacterized protein n=1 Tax=Trichogramma brassicae TaxID=86971 RepID=A0A6H5I9G1_9HYME|nr:unnamed protein product [Trichogramma brassicae]
MTRANDAAAYGAALLPPASDDCELQKSAFARAWERTSSGRCYPRHIFASNSTLSRLKHCDSESSTIPHRSSSRPGCCWLLARCEMSTTRFIPRRASHYGHRVGSRTVQDTQAEREEEQEEEEEMTTTVIMIMTLMMITATDAAAAAATRDYVLFQTRLCKYSKKLGSSSSSTRVFSGTRIFSTNCIKTLHYFVSYYFSIPLVSLNISFTLGYCIRFFQRVSFTISTLKLKKKYKKKSRLLLVRSDLCARVDDQDTIIARALAIVRLSHRAPSRCTHTKLYYYISSVYTTTGLCVQLSREISYYSFSRCFVQHIVQ